MTTETNPNKKKSNPMNKIIGVVTGLMTIYEMILIIVNLRYLIENFDLNKKKKDILGRYWKTLILIIVSVILVDLIGYFYIKYEIIDHIWPIIAPLLTQETALDLLKKYQVYLAAPLYLFAINSILYYLIHQNMEIVVNTAKFKKIFVDFAVHDPERNKKFIWTHVGVMMDTDKSTADTIAGNEALWDQLNITVGKPVHSGHDKSICLFKSGQELRDFYIFDDPEKTKKK
jgi:hypothetical protein